MDVSAVLNNNGEAVFDVDISTDGGLNWSNTFRRVAPTRTGFEPVVDTTNADGYFGHLALDVSAAAANQGTVRFRVRHFEPSFDWWIAIDNVIVDDVAPTAGGNLTLFEEDFSNGLGGMRAVSLVDPPNDGINTWTTDDPCVRSVVTTGDFTLYDGHGVSRLDEGFAILDSDCNPDPAEDEWLLTPVIDCSGNDQVFLHWSSEAVVSGGATQYVLVSVDGGATFDDSNPVFSYSAGGLTESNEEPFYAERIFAVPAAAGQSEVVFAFAYISGGNEWWWAVDNIAVTATSPDRQLAGDANQDANLDINDVLAYVGILFPGFNLIDRSTPDAPCATDSGTIAVLDVNGDGQVNTGDVVHLANYLFSGGDAPAQGAGCFALEEAEGCGDSCQ